MKAHNLHVQNSLTRQKEKFVPLQEGFVGMYVCGPTVYDDVHLGNCRTFTSFDMIYRYLCYLGYRVRYLRNITDVGHLLDDGEDRMSKGARLSKLEPMEVAHKYADRFHDIMRMLNTKSPSIEPRASGHIPEQIQMVQDILDNDLAYIVNGSVYFNTVKFAKEQKVYGQLSGRKIEDLMAASRDDLKSQDEKQHPSDFAIWMKAKPEHIMRWSSPWGEGFPGWHLECSAMSTKYLGKQFDIHGGGNDLKFPHHENEVAQNMGACGCAPVKYWLHTNMLLMNGKKMSKSDGNTISPEELFSGDSPHVTKGYTPNVVRFFMLQTHYGSTMDINDDALQASEKGYHRLMEGIKRLEGLTGSQKEGELDEAWKQAIHNAIHEMDDDFNAPKALAALFEFITTINAYADNPQQTISTQALDKVKNDMNALVFDIFGLRKSSQDTSTHMDGLMDLVLELRQQARADKNWSMSDTIRDRLKELNIEVKDGKDGSHWSIK
jgi:cysteinyl-tRNA synthetase